MSIFLQNIYKRSFVVHIHTIYKNTFQVKKIKLSTTDIRIYFRYYVPIVYLHSSSIFSKQKIKEIKAKQKDIEYISPRKKKKVIEVWKNMTIEDLGKTMGKNTDYVFELMSYVNNTVICKKPTDELDWNVLVDILAKANLRFKLKSNKKENIKEDQDVYPHPPATKEKLVKRPAVVTIMGHVDHGKTTLLDYLRKSSIVDAEFGGITQHIGAFLVKVKSDSITFLDTPGHAAFKAMRSRGAHCTDIVVLIVAADDGIMEQTVESIKMAKDANVPIIVAINKIDKPNADIDLTKKMLLSQNLIPEDMGGETQVIPISALKGTNIDALTEAILLQAEISNLKADPDGLVEGVILESKVDIHKGKLSTALIRRGTLKKGCILTAGLAWCKVKLMFDDQQKLLEKASPSTPVEVSGWKELPVPGDQIIEVMSEKRAHEVIRFRTKKMSEEKAKQNLPEIQKKVEEHYIEYKKKLLQKRKLGYVKLKPTELKQKEIIDTYTGPKLNIIIKSDVEGSLEALLDSLRTYYSPLCKLEIVCYGVGTVSLNDVQDAESFNAIIYNFNVDILPEAHKIAVSKNIAIRSHNVIYRFLEDIKNELNSRLPLKEVEEVTGEAVVLEQFLITEGKKKKIPVAGCQCIKGDLKKSSLYKVIRNGEEIYRGKLISMRNFKTEVNSIKKDQECGLRFEDESFLFKANDVIQAFRTYSVPQQIEWNPY